jgi:Fe-S cluster assembly iron-binding protein IscA
MKDFELNDSVKWSKIVCFSYTVDKVATSDELEDLLEKDGANVFVDNVSFQKTNIKSLTWMDWKHKLNLVINS